MPLTHFDAEGKARMVDVTEKKRDGKRSNSNRKDQSQPGRV